MERERERKEGERKSVKGIEREKMRGIERERVKGRETGQNIAKKNKIYMYTILFLNKIQNHKENISKTKMLYK